MTEIIGNVALMKAAEPVIEEAVRRLVEAADPVKVILFGSYARGEVTRHSDLDFLVILPTIESKYLEMVRLRRAIGSVGLPVDVLVYSVKEIEERGHLLGTTLHHALREGRLVYESA